MLMWVMSDRAIPRSYRMMQGFGVHTFRFVNADGESRFVKFHWSPVPGTHSLVWDEAVKISGADPDFHRRDLWEAIEAGAYPEWELGVQVFTEEDAERVQLRRARRDQDRPGGAGAGAPVGPHGAQPQPGQLLRRDRAGRLLHRARRARASTSATIRCWQGRIHSYVDTQISRLGGPNFHEIPINAPRRAGAQQPARRHAPPGDPPRPRRLRAELARRRLPVPGGRSGFMSFPEPIARRQGARQAGEVRRPLHAGDAVLAAARRRSSRRTSSARFRFELTQVQVPRDPRARRRACSPTSPTSSPQRSPQGLGIDGARRRCRARCEAARRPRSSASPALSLFARPGDGSIRTRRVAILVADGVRRRRRDGAARRRCSQQGAVPRFVGARLGDVRAATTASRIEVEATLETAPSVLFDALVVPDGDRGREDARQRSATPPSS